MMRREVLNAEWFTSLDQARALINQWIQQYNRIRPHQALSMRPPVPESEVAHNRGAGHPRFGYSWDGC